MVDNPNNELEWETPLPLLTYQDKISKRIQLLFPLVAAEKELLPTTKFLLASYLIKCYQQKDKTACTTLTVVMVKSIEGEDLIHHHGKIYIPLALRQRVLDWYGTMLVHL